MPRHGPSVADFTPLTIHQALLAAFDAHNVSQVYGFINGQRLEAEPELRDALDVWIAAGHPLGNHTYTHPALHDISVERYLEDIAANEPLLDELALNGKRTPTFRYPFLLEGLDEDSTRAIREYLHDGGYRIAPVTIDFYDWSFNGAFARCTESHDDAAVAAIQKAFIQHAAEMLDWSDAAAQDIYGRRIPQVLLIHSGAIDALMIEPLLAMMEKRGVEWITLDSALADPVYADIPIPQGRNQGTLLEQMIEARGAPHPPWNQHPDTLLNALCTKD